MSWKTRLLALMLALIALAPQSALADIFLSADFALTRGEGENEYQFTAAVPENVATSAPVAWPDGCRQTAMTRQSAAGRAQFGFTFACDHPFRADDVIRTPWKVDGGRFVSTLPGVEVDRSLSSDGSGITVPVGEATATARPLAELAGEFLRQGVWHILMGWDHLAFVLCLALLARGRQLVWLVSCFTIGHSISLGLAFFEVVRAPVPPVEAAIALSIVFMAREALRGAKGAALFAFRRQVGVVSLFGLLHGLGFATALGELGVHEGEKLASLAFFNIGVEIGQLVFVSAVMAALAGLRALSLAVPARAAALYAVGALGSFWMIERVAAFATV
ncbi:HupE/UreJ family protein [Novosphingobium album (ex Liu et al. 2023)]|uniref:HupE/UreJ family protein n=1 Tax=Novosphingobium album (ex Liu et al. 2023) TaxID=3031130 RepID=A0ABT5WUJ0_9SPHN|nr:HupE/UreJ family protein [Novosphingobium album (ex Liu et al. 2023)]MDE8653575.1 HupE/UreJ family protein [Novosphingobium album (ex Liu et al. 2023)]